MLVTAKIRPSTASVSHSVGWMLTGTPNKVNRIIAAHSMLRSPARASYQPAIIRIMTRKIMVSQPRFMLAECLRIV